MYNIRLTDSDSGEDCGFWGDSGAVSDSADAVLAESRSHADALIREIPRRYTVGLVSASVSGSVQMRTFVYKALEPHGWVVVRAISGEQALACIAGYPGLDVSKVVLEFTASCDGLIWCSFDQADHLEQPVTPLQGHAVVKVPMVDSTLCGVCGHAIVTHEMACRHERGFAHVRCLEDANS